MAFYFNKNGTKTQVDMTSIDSSGTYWKYKTKPTAGSLSWKASTVGVGTVNTSYFNINFGDKSNNNWYKAVPSSTSNAIYRIGFIIQQGKWWITEIEFRDVFNGNIRVVVQSITNGAGTSGAYSTVLDNTGGTVSSKYAYSGNHFYSYGYGLGSYSSTRYKITITATSTSGETSSVTIPLIYGSSKLVSDGTNSVTVYNIMIESGMTASGYDPLQRNTSRITSEDMGDQSNPGHVYTSTFLNLNDLTFKI